MKNYKILATGEQYPDVLLYRDIDEESNIVVIIYAIGIVDMVEDNCAAEKILFENSHTAMEFIENYTIDQAERWCRRQNILYWSPEKKTNTSNF